MSPKLLCLTSKVWQADYSTHLLRYVLSRPGFVGDLHPFGMLTHSHSTIPSPRFAIISTNESPAKQSPSRNCWVLDTIQIGTSIGLSLSSILLDRTIARKAREMGISIPSGGAAADNAPKEALLAGYRAAQWLGFGYSIFAMVLALLFLRDMGIIAPKDPNKSKKRRLAILRAREDSEDQSRQTKTGEPTFSQTPGPNSRQHDDNQSVFRKTEEV